MAVCEWSSPQGGGRGKARPQRGRLQTSGTPGQQPGGDLVYGYVANPQYWPVTAGITFQAGADVYDLIWEETVEGTRWTVALGPFDIRTFRVRGVAVGGVSHPRLGLG